MENSRFPKGTVVGVPVYAIHHKEEYHSNPLAYKPERWIASDGEGGAGAEDVATAQAAFCPFSIGPRWCIGKSLAYLEVSTTLARTVWLYDIRLVGGKENVRKGEIAKYALEDCFIAQKDGPMVEFRKRAL